MVSTKGGVPMSNNRISALRHEFGMNQRELGEKLGVGQTTVSAWEKGKNEPDHETLHKMAQLFRCSIGYLTGYENDNRTRGLKQEEIQKYLEQDQFEKENEKYEREFGYRESGLTAEEEEEIVADHERWDYQEWLVEHPDVYFEAYIFNQICERITAKQRKHLLEMALHYEQGIRS